jgi:2-polyprenyl-3-methyl-5-hydroxy-6-metoxy-1,4-benzoquinol methylase
MDLLLIVKNHRKNKPLLITRKFSLSGKRIMLTKRSKEKELLDLGSDYYTEEEYKHCLKQLFRVNKITGIFNHTVKLLKQFPNNITLADVGCGGGLFLMHLSKHFPNMKMTGIDISEKAIHLAHDELHHWKGNNSNPNIEFLLQHPDEFKLTQESIDIILLTLVCHHLEDEELIEFLKNAVNASRMALIINDLHRNSIAYWFYKLLSPIIFKNRLITHDGLISIQRSFTRKDLKYLLHEANIKNYQIKWCFPFRWSVLVWKNREG